MLTTILIVSASAALHIIAICGLLIMKNRIEPVAPSADQCFESGLIGK
jgi:hypothetical protein